MGERGWHSYACGPRKVPFVASDVEKYSDATVRLSARRGEESHACGCDPRERGLEVLDLEKETHPAGELPPDDEGLVSSISLREQQAVAAPGGRTRLTAWSPVVGQGQGVFHQLEAQTVDEEADGRIVLADHDGNEAEMHDASPAEETGLARPPLRLSQRGRNSRQAAAA